MDNELLENENDSSADVEQKISPVILPCGVYDEKGVLHKEVILNKMTGRDRKEIANQDIIRNGGKVITTLLTNCIKSIGDIDIVDRQHKTKIVREMLSCARTYLILQLRKISIGNSILLNLTCPNCSEKNEFDFKIDEIEVNQLQEEKFYRKSYERVMIIDLPEKNIHAVLRYPQGYDEETVFPLIKVNPIEAGQKMLFRCLKEFNGETSFPLNFIENMEIDVLDALTEEFVSRQPGPDIRPIIKCFNCGHDIRVEVSGTDFLFSSVHTAK